jgi:hypothetical protein
MNIFLEVAYELIGFMTAEFTSTLAQASSSTDEANDGK